MLFYRDKDHAARSLARAGMIGGMYVALTLIAPFTLSFGAIQFRIAEALTVLPILTVDAVPGLFIGCLLANLLGGGVWFDVVLGSIATLLAAVFARKWRSMPPLGAFAAVLFNGLIVGPVVYFAYVRAPGDPFDLTAMLISMGTVAIGEQCVCFLLGLPLYYGLKRLPQSLFD